MIYKCQFCERTFSRRSAYSQHVQLCIKKAELIANEEYSKVDTHNINNAKCSNVEIECEMDNNENNNTEIQDMSFGSIESAQSELISEMSTLSFEDTLEQDILELEPADILFPNDAYRDLMLLVTKNKLSNKAGNEIIQFFNKYSNLATSPLPKNIEKGRELMNNMKIPSLEFEKVLIINHNDKDYFLHYQNLMNCVKNILAVPGITEDFALSFKNYKVKMLIEIIKQYFVLTHFCI